MLFTAADKVLDRLGKGAKLDVISKMNKIGNKCSVYSKGLKAGTIKDNYSNRFRLEKEFNEKLKK